MDENAIRVMLIEEAKGLAETPTNLMTQTQVIARVSERMNIRGADPAKWPVQQLLLTVWHDLLREGYIAWGADLDHSDPPHCHLTGRGRQLLLAISRDPGNPGGYMAYLDSMTTINAVARSYIEEALATYRSQCWKATAVLVGAATESIVLDVRDAITARLDTPGVTLTVSRKERERLDHGPIKAVLDQLKAILDGATMPRDLKEEYAGYWGGIAHHARFARNDAGHPTRPNPVRAETVHAALWLFPIHAELTARLANWIPTGIA